MAGDGDAQDHGAAPSAASVVSPCIYCGREAAPFDEHEECVEEAMEAAVLDPPDEG